MKCDFCKDTGFYKGKLCTCITKKGTVSELDDLLKMFGMTDKKEDK